MAIPEAGFIAGNDNQVHEQKVRHISGRKLSRKLRKGLSPAQRALLAAQMEGGREQLGRGKLSLSAVHSKRKPATERDIERVVAKFGIAGLIEKIGRERVLAVFDAMTRPAFPTANDNQQTSFPFVGQYVAAAK